MPVLSDNNDLIQKDKKHLLKLAKMYYTGSKESDLTDSEFDGCTRLLYRTIYKNDLSPKYYEHYRKWSEHMTRIYGFGWKSTI